MAIDQVVIGSCTNGRIEDLRQAAAVLRGRKVHKNVRCIVLPATQAVWRQAMNEGLFDIFVEAEAVVSAPTCGPCLGGHMGILAAGERAVSTTNRNFVGTHGPRHLWCTWPGLRGRRQRRGGVYRHTAPGGAGGATAERMDGGRGRSAAGFCMPARRRAQ